MNDDGLLCMDTCADHNAKGESEEHFLHNGGFLSGGVEDGIVIDSDEGISVRKMTTDIFSVY